MRSIVKRNSMLGVHTVVAAAFVLLLLMTLPTMASAAVPATTVTLTFDDGLADQYTNALPALNAHGLNGTFYVNSAHVANGSQYLTWAQVQALAGAGNEIGGHTLDHPDLTTLDPNEAARQVCNDRVNLINQGLQPTDFAYPFGANNATVQSIVRTCGYNSARALGGIVTPFDGACSSGCPYAETNPPSNLYAIKTPDSVVSSTSLSDLETLVTQAQSHGGGWVNVVFHDVCDSACSSRSISPANFSSFLDWLQSQQSSGGVAVKTTQQVVGGSFQAAVPGPAPTGTSLQNASLETASGGGSIPNCWQSGGFGTNIPSFTHTSDAHSGSWAEQVAVSNFSSGAASLVVAQDQGQCSPAVSPGRAYKLSMWYKSSVALSFVAYYRDQVGAWHSLATSPSIAAASSWTNAVWTTPAMPSNATGISFGPMLTSNGSVTVDDLGLSTAPPTVSLSGLTAGKTYSGVLNLTANAGTGTDHVDFLVGGNVVGTASAAPWSITWNSANVSDGPTTVTARAVDAAGAFSAASVNISLDNSGSAIKDSSVEWTSNGGSTPDCWQLSGFGTNTFAWSHTSDSHSGSFGQRVDITSYTSGGRYLLTSQDNGPCAPSVTPGKIYTLSEWFKSNVAVSFLAYTRDSSGNWTLFKGSPNITGSATSWTQAKYTLPAIPAGATAISFGLQLASAGFLTVDDASILCGTSPCDITAPTSSATAPASSASGSIGVQFTARDNTGGSGLAKIDLYAKAPAASSYSKVATDTSGNATGTFNYNASAGDGSYSFYTTATDSAGNAEAAHPAADATTLLDTATPTSSASAPAGTASSSLTVSYVASDTQGGSGLAKVDLYAKAPAAGSYSKVATDTSGNGTGTFNYTASAGDGNYSFYTIATDKAGNSETAPAASQATTLVDTTAPSSSASAPATSSTTALSIAFNASDGNGGSGLAKVDLYAKGAGATGYSKVASDTSGSATGTFNYTASAGDGNYSFYTVASDKAGNDEAAHATADATTLLDTAAPTSSASSPAGSRSASLAVPFTASDGNGGSGLAKVDLYAKAPG
ncbi:MAG: polysaccharide deacetylase family protein, partial [Solirubrobacteraceae bacterium]